MSLALFVFGGMALVLALIVGGFLVFAMSRKPPPRAAPSGATAPEPQRAPMRVMKMRGFLHITDAAGQKREEPMPSSPYGAGTFPTACWSPGDGSVFAVGKLYTGKPGPDHGFVYCRSADGAWSLAHVLEERTFHSIAGRSPSEIYVGAMGGVVCFDGRRWSFVELPYPMVVKVFADGGEIVAQAFDGSVSFCMNAGQPTPTTAKQEPDTDPYSHSIGGVTYRVFDRSVEIGEAELSPAEEAELRGELEQLGAALRSGHAKVRRYQP